jgi:hypothetical protein
VIVLGLLPPWTTVTELGEADTEKSGAAVTVRLTVVAWLVDPEVPVTVTTAVPVVAEDEAVRVRVDVPLPLAGGVTEPGEKEAVTPLGSPLAERETAEVKPFRLPTEMVLVPLPPWATVTELGEADTEKSGVAVVVQEGNLKVAMRVLQLKAPVLCSYSWVYQNVQSSAGSICMAL